MDAEDIRIRKALYDAATHDAIVVELLGAENIKLNGGRYSAGGMLKNDTFKEGPGWRLIVRVTRLEYAMQILDILQLDEKMRNGA